MKSHIKFGVLSHSLPPTTSGQAVMLYRLLEGLAADTYCLLSKEKYEKPDSNPNASHWLPAKYYFVGLDTSSNPKLGKVIGSIPLKFYGVLHRIWKTYRILRAENCQILVGCTGAVMDIVGGYISSVLAGAKFVAYNFDDFIYQCISSRWRLFTTIVAPFIFSHSAVVVVPNEFLQADFKERFGIDAEVIRNPIDQAASLVDLPWPYHPDKIKIVYTGSIYEAHFDAFSNLVEAIRILGKPEIELVLYTPQTREYLAKNGVSGNFKVMQPEAPSKSIEIQKQADILFMGLAFQTSYPEFILNSAPGKLGEYLASGRPTLVHAPANSYICWYFDRHQCGKVVEVPDPKALANAIRQIIEDEGLRKTWVDRAKIRAQSDFSLEVSRNRFIQLIKNIG
jgi:glycosyltransferase involved in cell wall biosynthesis